MRCVWVLIHSIDKWRFCHFDWLGLFSTTSLIFYLTLKLCFSTCFEFLSPTIMDKSMATFVIHKNYSHVYNRTEMQIFFVHKQCYKIIIAIHNEPISKSQGHTIDRHKTNVLISNAFVSRVCFILFAIFFCFFRESSRALHWTMYVSHVTFEIVCPINFNFDKMSVSFSSATAIKFWFSFLFLMLWLLLLVFVVAAVDVVLMAIISKMRAHADRKE